MSMQPGINDDKSAVQALRRALAGISFLFASLAFALPAMADECETTLVMIRDAARDANLSEEQAAEVDAALDKALRRQEAGDAMGCLSELAVARSIIRLR